MNPPPAAARKRMLKQRWPFIKKRTYPNGSIGWMVDARTKNGGERKTYGTQGGKFAHGFFAGSAAAFASPFIKGTNLSQAGQVAAAAIVGGTSSELGGGKFSNGAVTGAFVYIFNTGLDGDNGRPQSPADEDLGHQVEDAYGKIDRIVGALDHVVDTGGVGKFFERINFLKDAYTFSKDPTLDTAVQIAKERSPLTQEVERTKLGFWSE